MTRRMVHYKVHPEQAEINEQLIGAVFEELRELDPPGVRYEAFVLADGVSFVHLVEHEDGPNPIPELASFKRYTAQVRERCAEPPVVTDARLIGSTGRGL
jgi:hypothetical protein